MNFSLGFSVEEYDYGEGVSFSHSDFCLCHLFTYEDLEEGVMGMAYRAEANMEQGVCAGSTIGLQVSSGGSSIYTTVV